MGPPVHLVTGQVGADKWHRENHETVDESTKVTKHCGKEGLELWRPVPIPGQPEETPYEAKLRKDTWKFKLDVLATGEVRRKPPEGPGVTLWKCKVKPPPWVSKIAGPCFRDYTNMKTNEYVAQYTKDTRLVVSRLRQALIEINEQVKTLIRVRERLDAILAKIRQSLLTNKQSQVIRDHRPPTEKIPDKVDALMKWEKKELMKLKVKLQEVMAMSEEHLKALGANRDNLDMLCNERGRVLDLMPQPLRMVLLEAGRDSWLGLSRPSSSWVHRNQTPVPDPIGPYTPECAEALAEARRLSAISKGVLVKVKEAIVEAKDIRVAAHKVIESSLQGKREETLCHKEKLDITLGGTRSTLHRCQRFQHEMGITRGMTLGPAASKYLETREKLTRPIVKVYQRHVGTQLPEPSILNQSTSLLERCMKETGENIQRLNDTRRHLRECIRDKLTGYEVDGTIKRLRQRNINPRTCMQEIAQLVYN